VQARNTDLGKSCSVLHKCIVIVMLSNDNCYLQVATDPGKLWKVLEFKVEIFYELKSLEDD